MGASWGNTFRHDYTFNNRFQPLRIQVWVTSWPSHAPCTTVPAGNNDQLDLTYSYVDANGHNNGNVASIANNLDWHGTQSFTYDSLNRLATARTVATNQPAYQGDSYSLRDCWGEQFSYDPRGNLTTISGVSSACTGCSQESLNMSARVSFS